MSRIGCDGLKRRLARRAGEMVYVSFDIDFVDAAHAPRVGSPELAGPSTSATLATVRALEGLDMIGFDLGGGHPVLRPAPPDLLSGQSRPDDVRLDDAAAGVTRRSRRPTPMPASTAPCTASPAKATRCWFRR